MILIVNFNCLFFETSDAKIPKHEQLKFTINGAWTFILEQYFGWVSTFEYIIICTQFPVKSIWSIYWHFFSWKTKKRFWQSFWSTVERSCGRMLHLRYWLWLRLFIPILVWTSSCFGLEGKEVPLLLICPVQDKKWFNYFFCD